MTAGVDTIRDAGKIRRMFGGIAGSYDFLNHLLSFNRDRVWRRRAVEQGDARGPVLDVCAGTGDMALEWAGRAGLGPVVASDFCVEMLRLCQEKARDPGPAAGLGILASDARALPFRAGTFGTVSAAFGIRNVSDLAQGIGEMARVARPGGEVRILEFTMPSNPLFRCLYLFYFLFVLPVIGNLLSGSSDGAYGYLPRSVLRFPGARELAGILGEAGLRDVGVTNLSFGIVNLIVGRKPDG